MSARGLEIAADIWAGAELTLETRWQKARALNREFVSALFGEGRAESTDGEVDGHRIVDPLSFPLSGLDLSMTDL